MQQDALAVLVSKGVVESVEIRAVPPSKGKPLLNGSANVWQIHIVFSNGEKSLLKSTRGSAREWASLDRLHEWLSKIGVKTYEVTSMSEIA